jgi:hypothetical protein
LHALINFSALPSSPGKIFSPGVLATSITLALKTLLLVDFDFSIASIIKAAAS